MPARLAPSLRFSVPLLLVAMTTGCKPGASFAANAPSSNAPVMPPSKHPLNGGNAPDFDLELYSAPSGGSERTVSLQASRGRVVLLDFWATWCKPCKASFPSYQHLQEKFGEQIQVIAISEDDETDGIASFIADTGVDFPVAWDADKSVARRYQIEGMPTLFIIDGSGIVHNVHSGFRAGDEAQIRRSIESALAVR